MIKKTKCCLYCEYSITNPYHICCMFNKCELTVLDTETCDYWKLNHKAFKEKGFTNV